MSDSETAGKHPGGRPTLYKEEYCELGYKLCMLGLTDIELAEFFGVVESTIYEWKNKHPEFSEALKRGKDISDADMAVSLYKRGMGYSHPEDKIFSGGYDESGNPREPIIVETTKHYPPDTAAAIIWLKNRQPRKWRDKQDHEHTGDLTVNIVEFKEEINPDEQAS